MSMSINFVIDELIGIEQAVKIGNARTAYAIKLDFEGDVKKLDHKDQIAAFELLQYAEGPSYLMSVYFCILKMQKYIERADWLNLARETRSTKELVWLDRNPHTEKLYCSFVEQYKDSWLYKNMKI